MKNLEQTWRSIARTFVSLCSLVILALKTSWTRAQRMPFTLLAEMLMPIPVPHIKMPLSESA